MSKNTVSAPNKSYKVGKGKPDPKYKWKKGDPSPNPAGRAKGSLNCKTIMRKWLEATERARNPTSGQEEEMTQLDIISLAQLQKARKGDTKAFMAILDRFEGKPSQPHEIDVDSKIILEIVRGKNNIPPG